MATTFQHVTHPHLAQRKLDGPAKTTDQRRLDHPNPIVRFNARAGLAITLVVGTMWCAYVFGAVAMLSAPSAFRSGNMTIIIAWVSSNFLQLVLLPVIIVGQNIQAKASDARADQTYNDADAILHEALQIQQHLTVQDDKIGNILTRLETLAGA